MDRFIDAPLFLKDDKWVSYKVGGGFIIDPNAPAEVKESYEEWMKSQNELKKLEEGD